MQETKRKTLRKLSKKAQIKKLALARFREHLPYFKFKVDFTLFCDNIHSFLTLNEIKSSKTDHDELFQASQNNMTEFTKIYKTIQRKR